MDEPSVGAPKCPAVKSLISLYEQSIKAQKIANQRFNKGKPLQQFAKKETTAASSMSISPKIAREEIPDPVEIVNLADRISVKTLIISYQKLNHEEPGAASTKPRRSIDLDLPSLKSEPAHVAEKPYNQKVGRTPASPASSTREEHSQVAVVVAGKPSPTELFDVRSSSPLVADESDRQAKQAEYVDDASATSSISSGHQATYNVDMLAGSEVCALDETFEPSSSDDKLSSELGISPLPDSYKVLNGDKEGLRLILPPPPRKSLLKKSPAVKKAKKVNISSAPHQIIETYNIYEYTRGDDELDPASSAAAYELEKKLEGLEQFEVVLHKDEKGLGLSIVGIGQGFDSCDEKLGIFIKALTPGGVAEKQGSLMVDDQILEVNGTSLVGVTQKFAGETLKKTDKDVRFIIGRIGKKS